eukprot:gene12882-7303_t
MKQTNLPCLRIQHDWNLSFKDFSPIWISCEFKEKKIYEEFKFKDEKLMDSKIFKAINIKENKSEIEIQTENIKQKFKTPKLSSKYEKSIECIDVSQTDENIGIFGSTYGSLNLFDTETLEVVKELKGHVGDILCCKILPSGKVGISGSSDTQIHIWRLEDGLKAATFKGHEEGVLSLAMIEKGRNFVSSSRDGLVKLWDCSTQQCITNLYNGGMGSINQVSVEKNEDFVKDSKSLDDREFGTEHYLTTFVSENGGFKVIDIRSRCEIFSMKFKESLQSCSSFDLNVFLGSFTGELYHLDLRNTKNIEQFKRDSSSIHSIKPKNNSMVWTSSNDGSLLLWDLKNKEIVIDLVGSNFDPLYDFSIRKNEVFSCCRDGFIRKYFV